MLKGFQGKGKKNSVTSDCYTRSKTLIHKLEIESESTQEREQSRINGYTIIPLMTWIS